MSKIKRWRDRAQWGAALAGSLLFALLVSQVAFLYGGTKWTIASLDPLAVFVASIVGESPGLAGGAARSLPLPTGFAVLWFFLAMIPVLWVYRHARSNACMSADLQQAVKNAVVMAGMHQIPAPRIRLLAQPRSVDDVRIVLDLLRRRSQEMQIHAQNVDDTLSKQIHESANKVTTLREALRAEHRRLDAEFPLTPGLRFIASLAVVGIVSVLVVVVITVTTGAATWMMILLLLASCVLAASLLVMNHLSLLDEEISFQHNDETVDAAKTTVGTNAAQ